MNKFQVWSEGYRATGEESGATFWGSFEGNTFQEACDVIFDSDYHKEYYDRNDLSYWGCRLFDNGNDAVEAFG